MEDLIKNLETRLKLALEYQNILEAKGEEYDEDCVCEIKSEFIRRNKKRLTDDQIDYISKI